MINKKSRDGLEFEKYMHNKLKNLEYLKCESEKNIRKEHKTITCIDSLAKYKDVYFYIQYKWWEDKVGTEKIKAYLRDISMYNGKNKIKEYVCYYVVKNGITRDAEIVFEEENQKTRRNIHKCIKCTCDKKCVGDVLKKCLWKKLRDEMEKYLLSKGYEMNNKYIRKLPKIELYEHQKIAIERFEKNFLKYPGKNGILSHITGSGKTISLLCMINKFWKKYPNLSVIWMTEKLDVIKSQFETDLLERMMKSDLLPSYKYFEFIPCYKYGINLEEINKYLDETRPILIVTNTDKLQINKKYEKMGRGIGLFVHDECHSLGAEGTFKIFKHFNRSVKHIIGASATPLRPDIIKYRRSLEIFGNEESGINFIDVLTLPDAIKKNIVVKPEFRFIHYNKPNEKYQKYEVDKEVILSELNNIIDKSKYGKVIIWTKTIQECNNWFKIFKSVEQDEYPVLSKYKIFKSHSQEDLKCKQIQKYEKEKNKSILICVSRCKEGYNYPKMDIGINITPTNKRGFIIFNQQLGRIMRKYKEKNKCIMVESIYKTEESSKYVTELLTNYICSIYNIHNMSENVYKKLKKELTKEEKSNNNVVLNINNSDIRLKFVFKNIDISMCKWKDIKKILLNNIKSTIQGQITYKQAKKILLKSYSNVKTIPKYKIISKNDPRLPLNPEEYFSNLKEKFKWDDYLGIDMSEYYNMKELTEITLKEYNNLPLNKKIMDSNEWKAFMKKLSNKYPKYPPDIEIIDNICKNSGKSYTIFADLITRTEDEYFED